MTYTGKVLPAIGYRELPVPNTLLQQDGETRQLAVVLPGRGYTCDMPLLYYSTRFLLGRGADVLQVEYAYHRRPDFGVLPTSLQDQWLYADVDAAYQAALSQRQYRSITLVGKSLGTRAMGHLLATDDRLAGARAIWITPLLRDPIAHAAMTRWRGPALYIIGTEDPHYDPALIRAIQEATGAEFAVIEGANHSLEIEGKFWQSLQILERVMRAIHQFLA